MYKNTGSSWNNTSEIWKSNKHRPGLGGTSGGDSQLIDVNGDGLPDIVQANVMENWNVYLNTGTSWKENPEVWKGRGGCLRCTVSRPDSILADVNGDGLPDIVHEEREWYVYLNTGSSWQEQRQRWKSYGGYIHGSNYGNARVIDVTGDGFADIVTSTGSSKGWEVYRNKASQPALLQTITASLGGITRLSYSPVVGKNNKIPFSLWTVKEKEEDNGVIGLHNKLSIRQYSFDGAKYDPTDKQFLGFATAEETLLHFKKDTYNLYQEKGIQGKTKQHTIRDDTNTLFQQIDYEWNAKEENGVTISTLDSETISYFDTQGQNPKQTKTTYHYDDYGNTTETYEHGFTDEEGDERFKLDTYTYLPDKWIMNRVSVSIITGKNKDEPLRKTFFTYDETNGNLLAKEQWFETGNNPVEQFLYDAYGNVTQHTDPNGNISLSRYDNTGTFLLEEENAKGHITTHIYDKGFGEIVNTTDANNIEVATTIDEFGRKTKTVHPYDSADFPTEQISYEYINKMLHITTMQRIEPGTDKTSSTITVHDGFGRVIQNREPFDMDNQAVIDTFYHESGEIESQSVAYVSPASPTYTNPIAHNDSTSTTIDPLGRYINVSNPNGTQRTIAYDRTTKHHKDENGHVKSFSHDAYGNIIQIIERLDRKELYTHYAYDSTGQIQQITDHHGNKTTYEYDSLGRKVTFSQPDMGIWTYTYDLAGNIKTQTDNRGITVTNFYDSVHNITTIDYPNQTDVQFTYDEDVKGMLSRVQDESGQTTFFYDDRLRTTKELKTINGMTFETRWQYNSMDKPVQITYPSGKTISYTYGLNDHISSIENYADAISYDQFNHITSINFSNGQNISYHYNPDTYYLETVSHPFLQQKYQYDNNGNITSIADVLRNVTATYTYDELDRLIAMNEPDNEITYEYDEIANLLSTVQNGREITFGYDNSSPHAPRTSSLTRRPTETPTPVPTNTPSPTHSPTVTQKPSPTFTVTPSPTYTVAPTFTPTEKPTETLTPTQTPTNTPTPTYTQSPSNTPAPTSTSFPTATVTPTDEPTKTLFPTATFTPTSTNSPVPTFTPTSTNSPVPTLTPIATNTPLPTNTPTFTQAPSPTHSPTVTQKPSPTFTVTPSPTFTVAPTFTPTEKPTEILTPTQTPTNAPIPTTTLTPPHTSVPTRTVSPMRTLAPTISPFPFKSFQGSYFNNRSLRGKPVFTRIDEEISFNWKRGKPTQKMKRNNFSVRWEGTFPMETGTYAFYVKSDDGIRLYINGKNVIDRWRKMNGKLLGTYVTVVNGNYDIMLEYFERRGNARVKLWWEKVTNEVAPTDCGHGMFKEELFKGKNLFRMPVQSQCISNINYVWKKRSPIPDLRRNNFSARWSGTFEFESGEYELEATADDGIRIWIDDKRVLDQWKRQRATTYTVPFTIEQGLHDIRVEYFERRGNATVQVKWKKM